MSQRIPVVVTFSVALFLAAGGAGCGGSTSTRIDPAIAVFTEAGNPLTELVFDPAPIGGFSERTFLVRSRSAAPLAVKGIEIEAEDGESHVAFEVIAPTLPLQIPALQEQAVTIRFAPLEVKEFRASAVLLSNDPDRPRLRIPLAGEGIAGRLEVSACLPSDAERPARCAETTVRPPDPLDLGDVVEGAHEAALITLFNGGGDALEVFSVAFVDPAAADPAGFTLPPNAGEGTRIEPLGSTSVRVDFNPPAGNLGEVSTVVRIESDSETDPVVDVEIRATVVPNRPPQACVFVREIRSADGRTTTYEPGDPVPAVEPTDVVIFDAAASEACSGDPEDGSDVTIEWTLTSPNGRGVLRPVPGAPTQRSLELEAIGTYRVDVRVRDRLGLEATEDAAGNPATAAVDVVPRQDIAVEIAWGDAPQVDIDLHFVRSTGFAGPLGSADDVHWANPSPNWGESTSPFDDPALLFDDLGTGALVETVVLNEPQADHSYWIFAHYRGDARTGRNVAPTCTSHANCTGGLVCSAGRCMEPVEVHLRVFLDGVEQDLTQVPGFEPSATLNTPCDTWLAGRIVWPAEGAPHFASDLAPIFTEGTPGENATCNLASTP